MAAVAGGFADGAAEGAADGAADGFADPPAEVLAKAAAAFGLLSSPARLHIVWALAQGESDVTGLAERVGGALPAVSQHLTKLKLAGLVGSRREGRRQVYSVDDPDVVAVVRVMVGRLSTRTPVRRHGTGA
ncbi:ArsR/SmtB family transcription factor [Streptomyces sp. NPDC004788]